jgi:hypothetical protein
MASIILILALIFFCMQIDSDGIKLRVFCVLMIACVSVSVTVDTPDRKRNEKQVFSIRLVSLRNYLLNH